MATVTIDSSTPSRLELELALRAAVLASPREHGRERAQRATCTLVRWLGCLAGAVAALDVLLIAGAG